MRSHEADTAFATRYGPWALIAGASDGTGRAFALDLAARGVPSVLIARRAEVLREVVDEIRERHGLSCVAACVDLSLPDAFERVRGAVGEREVGLFVSNAGADPHGAHFLDREVEDWLRLVDRNLGSSLRCCHHFGGAMRARRRGGIVMVGSGAGSGGGSYMATYSGTKAFERCFAESLWSELRPFGVDVLHLELGTTDTPALRKLLAEKGKPLPRRLAIPAQVAKIALDRLPHGPTYHWGQRMGLRSGWRRLRTRIVSRLSEKLVFGSRDT